MKRRHPLFAPQAGGGPVGFQVSGINHQHATFAPFNRQYCENAGKHPQGGSSGPNGCNASWAEGASHHHKPLRLKKLMPFNTRRSSTLGLPCDSGKNGLSSSICASDNQNKPPMRHRLGASTDSNQRSPRKQFHGS